MKDNLIKILKYAVFVGIGTAIMMWLYNTQNTAFQEQLRLEGKEPYPLIRKIIDDFKSVNIFWISMTLLAFTVSNWSRAVRWNMLIYPLGYRPKTLNAWFSVNISYFTNLWMSRAGEVVRAGTLAKTEKMSLSRVMGTVVVDRILDMVTLAFIVSFAFLIEYGTLWEWLDKNMGKGDGSFRLLKHPIFLGMVAFGIISLVLLWFFKNKIKKIPVVERLWHIVEKFTEGLKTIKKVENPVIFIFHSLNIWLMYFFMTYFCFFAFEPTYHLTPLAALTVFVFGTFGMVIPSPGGMGTYHFLATSALLLYGVKGDDAFSFANIMFFSIQIFYTIIVGIASIFLIRYLNKKSNSINLESILELESEIR